MAMPASHINKLDLNRAYALYAPSPQDLTVIHSQPPTSSKPVDELETSFISAFFKLAGQTPDPDSTKFFVRPRALNSGEILAKYLSEKKYTVTCPSPLYPGTYGILRNEKYGISVEQIPEENFFGPAIEATLSRITSPALWITSPNNPTGKTLTEAAFKTLIDYCEKNNKILILNTIYRFFGEPGTDFNQYQLLKGRNLDYAIIEDTGKTLSTKEPEKEGWITQGAKRSILAMSSRLFEPLHRISQSAEVNEEPAPPSSDLNLLTEIIENATRESLRTVRECIERNRAALLSELGSYVTPEAHSQYSLAWLKIRKFEKPLTASDLVNTLWDRNINVVWGGHFFQSNPDAGEQHIRVALSRAPEMFNEAVAIMKGVFQSVTIT